MKITKTCTALGKLIAPEVDHALRTLLTDEIPANARITFSVRTYEGGTSALSDCEVTFNATWDEVSA